VRAATQHHSAHSRSLLTRTHRAAGALLSAALPLAALGAVAGAAAGAFASSRATDELECRTHFFDLVAAALGAAQYEPLARESLLQMRLAVFARKGSLSNEGSAPLHAPSAPLFSDVRVWSAGAGPVAGVATKGAIGVSLRAGGTPLAFVACHLVRFFAFL
jgi:hypothetical protein